MSKREEMVLEISKLCRSLEKGEISIKDMPLNTVLDMTAYVYRVLHE